MENQNNPYIKYLQAKKLSENTLYRYGKCYERFEKYPFTQEGINQFFSNEKRNNSISHAFLKSLLEFLNVTDKFVLPPKPKGKKKQRIIRQLTQRQIQQIRDEAYSKKLIFGCLFDFLYYGALRRSEIAKLKVNSFNWSLWFDDPTKPIELKIELAKGNKDRMVLIPEHIIKKFLDYYLDKKNMRPSNPYDLISTLNNTTDCMFPFHKDGWKIWKIIGDLSQKAIQIRIRPHELRHARATELENKGLSIRAIQHYLGHSSPAITEIYLHTSEKHSLELVKDAMKNEKI